MKKEGKKKGLFQTDYLQLLKIVLPFFHRPRKSKTIYRLIINKKITIVINKGIRGMFVVLYSYKTSILYLVGWVYCEKSLAPLLR